MGTIVVLDSERLFRQLLIQSVTTASSHQVVGETAEFSQLHRLVNDYRPDFAIITLANHDESEARNITLVRAISPTTRLLLLSNGIPRARLRAIVKLEATGYINRDCEFHELLFALHEAEHGGLYLDPTLITAERLMSTITDDQELTPREREILPLLVHGQSNKAIARELGISIDTVKTHVTHIRQKFGVATRQAVPAYAVRLGLISAKEM